MSTCEDGGLVGQTLGRVSKVVPTEHVVFVTHSTCTGPGHGVGDAHRTLWNMFHLVGPLSITGLLLRPVRVADVDQVLSSTGHKHY